MSSLELFESDLKIGMMCFELSGIVKIFQRAYWWFPIKQKRIANITITLNQKIHKILKVILKQYKIVCKHGQRNGSLSSQFNEIDSSISGTFESLVILEQAKPDNLQEVAWYFRPTFNLVYSSGIQQLMKIKYLALPLTWTTDDTID